MNVPVEYEPNPHHEFFTTPTLAAYTTVSMNRREHHRLRETHPNNPPIQLEPFLDRTKRRPILLPLHRRHKRGLMHGGVEPLARLAGIEAVEPMPLQRGHQDLLRHLEAVDEVGQIRVLVPRRGQLGRRHGREGPVQVVDAVEQVFGEARDGEVARRGHVALGALLQVAEVGDLAEVFVLLGKGVSIVRARGGREGRVVWGYWGNGL